MAEIWERCNRFEYSATRDIVMTMVFTKVARHTRVWVRVSCAPFQAIAANTVIPLHLMMNGSKTVNESDSPTVWRGQGIQMKYNATPDPDCWFDLPFVFRAWDPDEMVMNVILARRNSLTLDPPLTHSTVPLFVRRVMVYSSL